MFSKEADLLEKISESRKAIRLKHMALKNHMFTVHDNINKVLKPIIHPLNKIASIKSQTNSHKFTSLNDNLRKSQIKNLPFRHSTPIKDNSPSDEFLNDDTKFFESKSTIKETENHKKSNDSIYRSIDRDDIAEESNVMIHSNYDYSDKIKSLLQAVDNKVAGMDLVLGVRKKYDYYKIGDKDVNFHKNIIIIGDKEYEVTDGLIELIFYKNINESIITKNDIETYKSIIAYTNALKKNYRPNKSFRTINYNPKFDMYLSKDYEGSGLPRYMVAQQNPKKYDYIYWNDPNEIVNRLRLLMAEKSAGNNSLDNEINSIIEELREEKIIY